MMNPERPAPLPYQSQAPARSVWDRWFGLLGVGLMLGAPSFFALAPFSVFVLKEKVSWSEIGAIALGMFIVGIYTFAMPWIFPGMFRPRNPV